MPDNTNTDVTDLEKIKTGMPNFLKIIGITSLILLLAFVIYAFFQFGQDFPYFTWNIENNPSEKILKDWKDTTSILNNFLSPVFLLLSVILLWLTWRTTKKQLKQTEISLNNQMMNQEKSEQLSIVSRQARTLDEKFSKLIPIITLIGSDGMMNMLINIKKLKLRLEVEDSLLNAAFSINSLIKKFKYCDTDYSWPEYFEKSLKENPDSFLILIHNQVALFYFKNIDEQTEVKSFYFLIKKIMNSPDFYRSELIEEFKLNFDIEIAIELIKLNPDISNDFFG
jgi:hypothetical protein